MTDLCKHSTVLLSANASAGSFMRDKNHKLFNVEELADSCPWLNTSFSKSRGASHVGPAQVAAFHSDDAFHAEEAAVHQNAEASSFLTGTLSGPTKMEVSQHVTSDLGIQPCHWRNCNNSLLMEEACSSWSWHFLIGFQNGGRCRPFFDYRKTARTPMDRPLFVPHPNDMQVQMLARRKAMAQAGGGWGCGVQGSDDWLWNSMKFWYSRTYCLHTCRCISSCIEKIAFSLSIDLSKEV